MKTKIEIGKTYETNPHEEFLVVGIEEELGSVFLKELNPFEEKPYQVITEQDIIEMDLPNNRGKEYLGCIEFTLEIFESLAIEIK